MTEPIRAALQAIHARYSAAKGRVKVGRLALRVEGENWNAYYALPDDMEKAIFLGSIRMAFVYGHPQRKDAFIALMRDGVGDLIERATGVRPVWPDGTVPAPEHERTRE